MSKAGNYSLSGGQSGLVMLKEILARSLTGSTVVYEIAIKKDKTHFWFFDCYIVVVITKKEGT